MSENRFTLKDLIDSAQSSFRARQLAFFVGYLDDSGTHQGSEVVVAGAVMANVDAWSSVSESWQDVLDKYGVSCFHYSDYDSNQGEFRGWGEDRERKIAFLRELIGIASSNCSFVAYGNLRKSFEDAVALYPQEAGLDLYSLSVELCATYMLEVAKKDDQYERLDLNIPNKPRYTGDLLSYLMNRRKSFKLSINADSSLIPHQIADMVAREHYKFLKHLIASVEKEGDEVDVLFRTLQTARKSMRAMMQNFESPFATVDIDLDKVLRQRKLILSRVSG